MNSAIENTVVRKTNRCLPTVTRRGRNNPSKSVRHDVLCTVKMYAELEQKVCTRCKEAKEKKQFSLRSSRRSGKASWCKPCLNEWRRAYKEKNRAFYQKYEFARGLKRHYGISVSQYNQMLKDQNGCCACCGKHEVNFKRRLHVDHDSNSGQVRALLCTECNPGMGYFQHSTERLEMAIQYLNKFKK